MANSAFEFYTTYLALKQHFKRQDYDYFKYQGRVSATPQSFEKRNDAYHFKKCAKKYTQKDFVQRCVANFFHDADTWIKDLTSAAATERLQEMSKRQSAVVLNARTEFRNALKQLKENNQKFDDLFLTSGDDYAMILRLYFYDEMSPETLIVLNEVLGFFKQFKRDYAEDIVVRRELLRLEKLSRFMSINKTVYKEMFVRLLTEEGFQPPSKPLRNDSNGE